MKTNFFNRHKKQPRLLTHLQMYSFLKSFVEAFLMIAILAVVILLVVVYIKFIL